MKLNKNDGFTLIEMMIVIAVFGILAAIAIPSFGIYTRNKALQAAANELAGDIKLVQQRSMADNAAYTLQFTSGITYTYQFVNPVTGVPEPVVAKNLTTMTNYNDINISVNTFPGLAVNCTTRGAIALGAIAPTVTLTNSRGSTVAIAVSPTWRLNVTYTPN